jgi:hypothetical protein
MIFLSNFINFLPSGEFDSLRPLTLKIHTSTTRFSADYSTAIITEIFFMKSGEKILFYCISGSATKACTLFLNSTKGFCAVSLVNAREVT